MTKTERVDFPECRVRREFYLKFKFIRCLVEICEAGTDILLSFTLCG